MAYNWSQFDFCFVSTGFIRSGKIRGKHIFFEMVRESQGIQRKSQEKVGKSQGDFFGKFLSPLNQDPLFILAIVCQTSFCWLILYCSFIF